jgi:hypothetical protein
LGPVHEEAPAAFALAPNSRIVARLAPDQRLSAHLLENEQIKSTDPTYSPILTDVPDTMEWSSDGTILIVTLPNQIFAAYKPIGLRI